MNTLLSFLVLIVLLKMMIQMGFYSMRGAAIAALLYALVPIAFHLYALGVNRLSVEQALSTQSAMSNISLIIIIDLMLTVYFCIYRQRSDRKQSLWNRIISGFIRNLPSLVVIPALAYIQLDLFFSAWGVSFAVLTGLFALATFLLFFLSGYLSRYILGGNGELMSEVVILLSFFIFIYTVAMGLIKNTAYVGSSGVDNFDGSSFLFTVAVFAAFLAIGYILSLVMNHLKTKNNLQ